MFLLAHCLMLIKVPFSVFSQQCQKYWDTPRPQSLT